MNRPTQQSLLALILLLFGCPSISEEQITEPAKFITSTPPKYPDAERNAGHKGTAKVKLLVDTSGSVAAAEISQSSGWPALDKQALIAAKKWTFAPAKKNDGKPVESQIQVPITFGGPSDEQLAREMTEAINKIIVKPCKDFISEVEKQQAATPDKPPYSSVQSFVTPWSLAFFGLNTNGQNVQATKVLKNRAALFSTVLEKCKFAPEEPYDEVFKTSLKALVTQ